MERFIGVLSLLGGFTLAGTSVIAGRLVSEILGTFTIAAVSLFFALLGLLPLCARMLGETIRQMSMRDWLSLLVQALFGIFLFRMFLLQGLIRTSAGEAGVLTGATPAATMLLAWLFLKEPLDILRFLGVVSTVAGILVLQGVFSTDIGFSREHLIGNLLVLCAAVSESLFNVFSRISSIKAALNQSQALDPIVQTTLVVGIALLLCFGPALVERPVESLMSLGIAGWLALVWYGVFVTALAFILWYAGIKRCDASMAAAFSGMMPFTALILSVLLLGEQPGWQQWLGGLMVMSGMLLTGLKLRMSRTQAENNY
ncbi:DMT family transporter [Sporomusa malonica]|uniref:Uncharacterized membrane protein n=1 Tax=Sporomusa malonica TaxID=112901 RepID=A0A1W2E147_9FIRM|nr:DMT family transporter [Sporomusa malonica]SMD03112.1 Uncharacterized membrane protein [Sporomusa malonica]